MSEPDVKKLVNEVLHGTSDSYVQVGTFLLFRQLGTSPNFQVSSNAPGTDGNEAIILFRRDLFEVMNFLVELTETLFRDDAHMVKEMPRPVPPDMPMYAVPKPSYEQQKKAASVPKRRGRPRKTDKE